MNKDLVFLGIQGCGKGTQAKLLLEHLPNHRYFEMGQTLRSLMALDNMIGNYIKNTVNSGKMIDNFITHDLIHTGLKIVEKNNAYIIVDGFPRMLEQAQYFTNKMMQMKRDFIVIHLELEKELALERMIKRAQIEGRKDDNPEAIATRITTFMEQTLPTINYFVSLGKVITIDASGTIEEVHKKIMQTLGL